MALGTDECAVATGQEKATVIACRRRPCRSAVTLFTRLGEALTRVVGRSRIVCRMARVTIGRNCPERPARMALGTEQATVTAGQREYTVIERRGQPRHATVTLLARVWIARTDVVGSPGVLTFMAGVAVRRNRSERPARVALRAQ